jgi:hypothetical protein
VAAEGNQCVCSAKVDTPPTTVQTYSTIIQHTRVDVIAGDRASSGGLVHGACTLTSACACAFSGALMHSRMQSIKSNYRISGGLTSVTRLAGGNVLCQIIVRSRAFMNGNAPRHVHLRAWIIFVRYTLQHRHKQKCRAGCCSRAGQSRSQKHVELSDLHNCIIWDANGTGRSPWPTSELDSVAARCRATRPSVRARPRTCRVIASATATKTVKIGEP